MDRPILLQSEWCEQPHEIRSLLRRKLGLKPDENSNVVGDRVISDGISQGLLTHAFTAKKMRKYLGTNVKGFRKLFKMTIAMAKKEEALGRAVESSVKLKERIEQSKAQVDDREQLKLVEAEVIKLTKEVKREPLKKVSKKEVRRETPVPRKILKKGNKNVRSKKIRSDSTSKSSKQAKKEKGKPKE